LPNFSAVNSDAHVPTDVGVDFDKALELVGSAGYTTTVRFEKRQRTEVPLV
jgi:histidinol-phosphatase (PHP family)